MKTYIRHITRFIATLVIIFPLFSQAEVCTSDTICQDHLFCNGHELCRPGAPGADSRGCVAGPLISCSAGNECREGEQRCGLICYDNDGDGVSTCDGDCDDNDARRYPGHPEVCDGANLDEDCNSATFGTKDNDGDGYSDFHC